MLVTHSTPTLCNPMDCSLAGSSVHGILQARILEFSRQEYWNSPGKNTGVGIYLYSAQSLQSCPTLCDPMDCRPPGSSVHWIL